LQVKFIADEDFNPNSIPELSMPKDGRKAIGGSW
jgi:hypothetical protein